MFLWEATEWKEEEEYEVKNTPLTLGSICGDHWMMYKNLLLGLAHGEESSAKTKWTQWYFVDLLFVCFILFWALFWLINLSHVYFDFHFCAFCVFLGLFVFFCGVCARERERGRHGDGWGCREDLEGIREGESMISIYCMKTFFNDIGWHSYACTKVSLN